MKGKIWGSRGSIASPGQDTERYGGNTSCVELRPPGCDVVILDAGTGIRELGVRLVREGAERMFLLLTHLHVDHLEGLGMFEPIWRKQTELHIWGPASPVASLEERIATYFSPPLFPVHLSEVPASIEYHDASESEWQIDEPGIWKLADQGVPIVLTSAKTGAGVEETFLSLTRAMLAGQANP